MVGMAPTAKTSWLDVLRAAFWPLVIGGLLIFLGRDIRTLLRTTSELQVGSFFNVKLRETAKLQGDPELAALIANLNLEDLNSLMRVGEGRYIILQQRPSYRNEPARYILDRNFETYRKLDRLDLVAGTDDFLNKWNRLNPSYITIYYDETGQRSTTKPDATYNRAAVQQSLPVSSVTNAQTRDVLNRAHVRLTGDGKKAYNLVLKVVTEQIAQGKAVPPSSPAAATAPATATTVPATKQ